ncbi:MAG: Hsp20/alpha crystallin family protein [Thermodesulfobacteriota bacterium]|jgi:HSP20 family protein
MAKRESWLPLPVQQLSDEVDRLFDELIYRRWGVGRPAAPAEEWAPQLDLYETDTAFILEADLPGVKKHDVSVEVEDGDLILQGRRAVERVKTEGNFHCRERRSGRFLRRLRLPASVDREQIRAEFRNGVLRVTLPKVQGGGQRS